MSDLLIEVEELLNSGLATNEIATKMGLSVEFIETAVEMIEQDI